MQRKEKQDQKATNGRRDCEDSTEKRAKDTRH